MTLQGKLGSGFTAATINVLVDGDEPVVAYYNSFKGRDYFHIRKLWRNDSGAWMPGKGLSVAAEQAAVLLSALGEL